MVKTTKKPAGNGQPDPNTLRKSTGNDSPKAASKPKTGWGTKKPTPSETMHEAAEKSDGALKESISSVGAGLGPKSVVETIKAAQEAGNYPDDAQTDLESAIANAENEGTAATAPAEPADASQDVQATTLAEGSYEPTHASSGEGDSAAEPYGFPASAIEQTPSPMEEAKKAEAGARASDDPQPTGGNLGAARNQLIAFVERIERLTEEKQAIQDDIKEVFAEAKGTGFDTATMRKAISRRAMDPDKRAEMDALLDTYEHALGEV